MLRALHANDVVPVGTNEKIQVFRLGFFGAPLQNRSIPQDFSKLIRNSL